MTKLPMSRAEKTKTAVVVGEATWGGGGRESMSGERVQRWQVAEKNAALCYVRGTGGKFARLLCVGKERRPVLCTEEDHAREQRGKRSVKVGGSDGVETTPAEELLMGGRGGAGLRQRPERASSSVRAYLSE